LLNVLTPNIDHARVVHLLRKSDAIALAADYLKAVQKDNLTAVNEALNDLYILEEDHKNLRQSVDDFNNFDQILLAQKCEKHELLEFRRIASYVYKINKRFLQSVSLSKADKMYKDAIDTAAASQSTDIAEDLLRYFVETIADKSCFSACLYTCYDLIRPDVAIELGWRHGIVDHVMPYVVQYMRHLHDKVKVLEERTAPPKEEVVPEAAVIGVEGGLIMTERLMLGDGSGYNYAPNGNSGIPDPYAQQQQGYGYNGYAGNVNPGYGGGYGQQGGMNGAW